MQVTHLVLALLAPHISCALGTSVDSKIPAKRVAIIGAGAAGSSTAYHLSALTHNHSIPTNITVYERNPYIGGRTTTVNAWDDASSPIELGGSIFVAANRILVEATKDFNLSTSSPSSQRASVQEGKDRELKRNAEDKDELGIWNGREFVLITPDELGWWDKAKLLWRYGLAPIRTNALMKKTVDKFLTMYDEPVFPWVDLGEVAAEVGLLGTTSVTGEQLLQKQGAGGKFAKEIVQASTRVNYASNIGLIHGLETMVCMAANGAMSVESGNWQIFSHMLSSSSPSSPITAHLDTSITHIQKNDDGTYTLTTTSSSSNSTSSQTYDTIILSAPYQFSNVSITPEPAHVPSKIPYVGLHVTLFASPYELSPLAFNLSANAKTPTFILTTLPENEDLGSSPNGQGSPGFFSISKVSQGANPKSTPPGRTEYVYKIFSAERVNATFLSRILGMDASSLCESRASTGSCDPSNISVDPAHGPITWLHQHRWDSYPYEYPRVTFEHIRLDDGLWYTSGIESFISTMETSALMGKNVARLIVDEWIGGLKGGKSEGGVNVKEDGDRKVREEVDEL